MAEAVPFNEMAHPDAGAASPGRGLYSLVDVDPELVAGIPDDDRELARRFLARPVHTVATGDLDLGAVFPEDAELGLLIVEGAVERELHLVDRHSTAIFGPGDVIGPSPSDDMLQVPVAWRALRPTRVMPLDARFARAAQRWPSLVANLQRRVLEQSYRGATQAAISQLPRVELRLLALLWQLADRWGKVTPFGVEITLDLTHEALGRLIGAQRPTVTLALGELAREAAVTRTVRRTWLLSRDSRDLLRGVDGAASSGSA